MRYWWVNQKRTYRHEVGGGYLWSPKVKSNGSMNPYYEFMREVSPGDLVLSYASRVVGATGIALSYAYEAPQPDEFGGAGSQWDHIGWRVDVTFQEQPVPMRPKDWIEALRPLLPSKHSPLLADGRGRRDMYLTELPQPLALRLAELIGAEISAIVRSEVARDARLDEGVPASLEWENHLRRQIEESPELTETEKSSLVLSRRGQGLFRSLVQLIEKRCRITGVDKPEHLRASHCKPWRDSSNKERLDGENGLLLTPSIDHLFDRGFISFEGNGALLTSPVAHGPSLAKMGVPVGKSFDTGRFTPRQARFLEYHRDCVFLRSRVAISP